MKSTQRRTRLHRRSLRITGDAHDPGSCLDGEIHRQVVTIRTGDTEAGSGRVHQSRVDLAQDLVADTQSIHRARREILQQDIGADDHLPQQVTALL